MSNTTQFNATDKATNSDPATPPNADNSPSATQTDTSSTPSRIRRPPRGPGEVLGDVSWLMARSPAHRHLLLADLEWLVVPPLMRKQFRLFRNGERPFAYTSWAYLDEVTEQRLLAGQTRLQPGDWHAGNRPWIIDIVVPFGGREGVINNLKQTLFKDAVLKVLNPAPDGKEVAGDEVSDVMSRAA
jgi:cytolysin-activating lysine-acyltransferase